MNDIIKCPKCGNIIDLSNLMKEKYKKENDEEMAQKRAEYIKHSNILKDKEKAIEEKEKNIEEQVKNLVKIEAEKEKKIQEEQIRKQIENENSNLINWMQNELKTKNEQIKKSKEYLIEIENLKNQNLQMKSDLDLQYKKQLNQAMIDQRTQICEEMNSEFELKITQKDLELERLKKKIDSLQKSSEISSQELVGEAQEVAIFEFLKEKFPLDEIEDVKKGANGADVLQKVIFENKICGKIYFESKRTKNFSKEWIEKLKNDMREIGADLGVLVSSALPENSKTPSLINGIWVCDFSQFKTICEILRFNIIEISQSKLANQNVKTKTQMLYNYLTSSEFKLQTQAILESFTQMQMDLEKEKNVMNKIFKMREKQIEKAKTNAIAIYGSVKGIAGNAVENIEILELDFKDEVDK